MSKGLETNQDNLNAWVTKEQNKYVLNKDLEMKETLQEQIDFSKKSSESSIENESNQSIKEVKLKMPDGKKLVNKNNESKVNSTMTLKNNEFSSEETNSDIYSSKNESDDFSLNNESTNRKSAINPLNRKTDDFSLDNESTNRKSAINPLNRKSNNYNFYEFNKRSNKSEYDQSSINLTKNVNNNINSIPEHLSFKNNSFNSIPNQFNSKVNQMPNRINSFDKNLQNNLFNDGRNFSCMAIDNSFKNISNSTSSNPFDNQNIKNSFEKVSDKSNFKKKFKENETEFFNEKGVNSRNEKEIDRRNDNKKINEFINEKGIDTRNEKGDDTRNEKGVDTRNEKGFDRKVSNSFNNIKNEFINEKGVDRKVSNSLNDSRIDTRNEFINEQGVNRKISNPLNNNKNLRNFYLNSPSNVKNFKGNPPLLKNEDFLGYQIRDKIINQPVIQKSTFQQQEDDDFTKFKKKILKIQEEMNKIRKKRKCLLESEKELESKYLKIASRMKERNLRIPKNIFTENIKEEADDKEKNAIENLTRFLKNEK